MIHRACRLALLLATAAAVAASAMIGTAVSAAAASVLAPGSEVFIDGGVNAPTERCTAGFVARNGNGAAVMFTAGHCAAGGERVMMKTDTGQRVQVGEMVVSQFDGTVGDDTDIAVLRPLGVAPLVSSVDGATVTGALPVLYHGLTLCMLGATTGRSCGPVMEVSNSKVRFGARVDKGDSGGPVWAMTESGDALAVGVVIRETGDGFPVAELLAPWLKRYRLTIA